MHIACSVTCSIVIIAASGCLFRLPSGIKPAIGGTVLGTLLR